MENKELENKVDMMIDHGVSISEISNLTGIIPENIASYIYGVWKEKTKANKEKFNRSLKMYGYNMETFSKKEYFGVLETQGIIKHKQKVISR